MSESDVMEEIVYIAKVDKVHPADIATDREVEVAIVVSRIEDLSMEVDQMPTALMALRQEDIITEEEVRVAIANTITAMPEGPAKTEAVQWAKEGGM